eukprot:gene12106-8330_t
MRGVRITNSCNLLPSSWNNDSYGLLSTIMPANTFKVYLANFCPYCQKAEITAKEKNVKYEREEIDVHGTVPEFYKKLNPSETVPTLVVDGSKIVLESNLVAQYFDSVSSPSGALFGTNATERQRIELFMTQVSQFVGAARAVLQDPLNPEKRTTLEEKIACVDGLFAEHQITGPFFLDETFSFGDICILPFLHQYRHTLGYYAGYDVFARAPHLKRMYGEAIKRESVKSTLLSAAEDIAHSAYLTPDNSPFKNAGGGHVIFTHPLTPFGDRVRLAANIKGFQHTNVEISLPEVPVWFKFYNPRETVPMMMAPNGEAVHESNNIVQYIDQVQGSQGRVLLPRDTAEKQYAVQYFIAMTDHLIYGMGQCAATRESPDALAELKWAGAELEKLLQKKAFGDGPFFGGQHMNAGDIALLPMLVRINAMHPEMLKLNFFAEFKLLDALLKAGVAAPESKGVFQDSAVYLKAFKDRFSTHKYTNCDKLNALFISILIIKAMRYLIYTICYIYITVFFLLLLKTLRHASWSGRHDGTYLVAVSPLQSTVALRRARSSLLSRAHSVPVPVGAFIAVLLAKCCFFCTPGAGNRRRMKFAFVRRRRWEYSLSRFLVGIFLLLLSLYPFSLMMWLSKADNYIHSTQSFLYFLLFVHFFKEYCQEVLESPPVESSSALPVGASYHRLKFLPTSLPSLLSSFPRSRERCFADHFVHSFALIRCCAAAAETLAQLSPSAALPVPLAAAVVDSHLSRGSAAPLVSLFATHPDQGDLVRSVAEGWRRTGGKGAVVPLSEVVHYLNLLSRVDAPLDSVVFAVQCAVTPLEHLTPEALEAVEGREELRQWISRFVRYHPGTAPALLRPLCVVTTARVADPEFAQMSREAVVEVVRQALRVGFVAPQDCGLVLRIVRQPHRVLQLWRWMQHTSAKWNQEAASAAVVAQSRLRRFSEAVTTLQALAGARVRPTAEAQVAFIDLLAHTVPPLPEYADQLVRFWYEKTPDRWRTGAVDVSAAQMFLHFRCGNYAQCLDLMSEATEHLLGGSDSDGEAALVEFVSSRGVYSVVRYFFDDILKSHLLLELFYNAPLSLIKEFAARSTVISILIGIARRLPGGSDITNLCNALEGIAPMMDDHTFEQVIRATAEDYSLTSAEDTLRVMRDIAASLNKEIPEEVLAWIQLLEKAGPHQRCVTPHHTIFIQAAQFLSYFFLFFFLEPATLLLGGPYRQRLTSMTAVAPTVKNFGLLCRQVADEPSLLAKTEIIDAFTRRFAGDVTLLYTLLLPKLSPRVYHVQEKQLLSVLADVLRVPEPTLKAEWNANGCVAETALLHFSSKVALDPDGWCSMQLSTFNQYLDQFADCSTNVERASVLRSFFNVACPGAVYYLLREIKQDIRLNAGQRTVLDGLHIRAYDMYKHCASLPEVIRRVQSGMTRDASPQADAPCQPSDNSDNSLVEDALKKCPNGAYSEVKYDGERIQVHKNGGTLHFFSRSLKPMKPAKYASIETFLEKAIQATTCILDGEILMVDQRTSVPLPFGTLGSHKRDQFATACPCIYFFDILFKDGANTMALPLHQRRDLLKKSVSFVRNRVMFSELCVIDGDPAARRETLQKHLNLALCEGLEGLVIKDVESVYEPRARHWLKIKKDYLDGLADLADLFVIGAWFGSGSKGGQLQTYLMGCVDPTLPQNAPGRVKTVCKVTNGLNDCAVTALTKRFMAVMVPTTAAGRRLPLPSWLDCSAAHVPDLVMPDYRASDVMMIIGAELTASTSHTSGLSIRFPRVMRLRPDKTVDMATTRTELQELFEASIRSSGGARTGMGFKGLRVEDATARPPGLFEEDEREEVPAIAVPRPTALDASSSVVSTPHAETVAVEYRMAQALLPLDDGVVMTTEHVMICHCAAQGRPWSSRGFMGRATSAFGSWAQQDYDSRLEGGTADVPLGTVVTTEVGPQTRPGRVFLATMVVQRASGRGVPTLDEAALRRAMDHCVATARTSGVRTLLVVRPPAATPDHMSSWPALEGWWKGAQRGAGVGRIVVFPAHDPSAAKGTTSKVDQAPVPAPAPAPVPKGSCPLPAQSERCSKQQLRLDNMAPFQPQQPAAPLPADHHRQPPPEGATKRERDAPRPPAASGGEEPGKPLAGVVAYVIKDSSNSRLLADAERAEALLPLMGGVCADAVVLPGGAAPAPAPTCTHVIVQPTRAAAAAVKGWRLARGQSVVTVGWVLRCFEEGRRVETALFHPARRLALAGCALLLPLSLPLRDQWAALAASHGAAVHETLRLIVPSTTHCVADVWREELREAYRIDELVVRLDWLIDSVVAGEPLEAEPYYLHPPDLPPKSPAGAPAAALPTDAPPDLFRGLSICLLGGTLDQPLHLERVTRLVEQCGGTVVPHPSAAQVCLSTSTAFTATRGTLDVATELKCVDLAWLGSCVRQKAALSLSGFLLMDRVPRREGPAAQPAVATTVPDKGDASPTVAYDGDQPQSAAITSEPEDPTTPLDDSE